MRVTWHVAVALLFVLAAAAPSFADDGGANTAPNSGPELTYQEGADDFIVPDFPAPQEYSISSQSFIPGESHQVRAEFNVPEDIALSGPAMFKIYGSEVQVVNVFHDGKDVTEDWDVETVADDTAADGSGSYTAVKQAAQSKLIAAGNYAIVFEQATVSSASPFQKKTASDGRGVSSNYTAELHYEPVGGEETVLSANQSAYFTDSALRIAIERDVVTDAASITDFKAGGAVYGIYDAASTEKDGLVQTVHTDGSGLAVSSPLPDGYYYVREITPSAGCVASDVVKEARLYSATAGGDADDKGYCTVKFTVSPEGPIAKTGDSSFPVAMVIVLVAALSAAGTVWHSRRRGQSSALAAASGTAVGATAVTLSLIVMASASGTLLSFARAADATASGGEGQAGQAKHGSVMPSAEDWLSSTGDSFPSQGSIASNMFDIPPKVHVGDYIRVKAPRHSGELKWEGTSNIDVSGLSGDGGYVKVLDTGDVVLTAKSGATTIGSSSSKAYPVHSISVGDFPADAYIGNVLTLAVDDLLDTDTVRWEIQDVSYSGKSAFGTAFLGDEPGKDGGVLLCAEEGVYSFTLVVETGYGDVIRIPMSKNLHVRPVPDVSVNAPEIAYAGLAFDVSAEITESYPVNVGYIADADVPDGAFDADGTLVNPGLLDGKLDRAGFSNGKLLLPLGDYHVVAWTKDAIGTMFAASSKVSVQPYPEPTVSLSSAEIVDGIASSGDLKVNVAFSALGNVADLAIIDYYDQAAGKAKYSLPKDLNGTAGDESISHKTYANGNHLLVAQVKDENGHDAYATLSFNVGGNSASGDADISISQTTTVVTDKVTFDGGKTYAFVDGFTFNVPAISGHSSGNQDWIEVEGITVDGSSTVIIAREDAKTNTGQAQVTAVKGEGTWSTTVKSDQEFSFDPGKYVQLRLTYYNAHESCLKQATEAMTYSTSYTLTMDDLMLDALKKLFE